jgi:hypothetical protein
MFSLVNSLARCVACVAVFVEGRGILGGLPSSVNRNFHFGQLCFLELSQLAFRATSRKAHLPSAAAFRQRIRQALASHSNTKPNFHSSGGEGT